MQDNHFNICSEPAKQGLNPSGYNNLWSCQNDNSFFSSEPNFENHRNQDLSLLLRGKAIPDCHIYIMYGFLRSNPSFARCRFLLILIGKCL